MHEHVSTGSPWTSVLPPIFPAVQSADQSTPGNNSHQDAPATFSAGGREHILPSCRGDEISLSGAPVSPLSPDGGAGLVWTREEARLFMHYVHDISYWLDIFNKHRHFGIDVPKRACHSPLLAFSIIAFSSRHVSLTTGTETVDPGSYYSKALQTLIPILDGPIEALNDDVLAAIALLRLYEEMQGKYPEPWEGLTDSRFRRRLICWPDDDFGTHLSGSSRLLNSPSSLAAKGGLGEAASWLALRQDIYICLTRSQPMSIHLENYTQSESIIGVDAVSMANRAVLLCAQVLTCAIRPEVEASMELEAWNWLNGEVDHWLELIPSHATLLWAESQDQIHGSSPFPTIWMTRPAYVSGHQHIYLARILLHTFNPRLRLPGFKTFKDRRDADLAVIDNLRLIIGLAISNLKVINASFAACHVLQACGMYLTDPRERDSVLEFLDHMTRRTGWRTGHIANQLRAQWAPSPRQ